MDGGLFQAQAHAGLGMLLTQLAEPFPEGFRGGVDGGRAGLAGGGVDEVQVGFAVGAIQADDQVVGMRSVHGFWLFDFGFPAGLTWRRQYRRVVIAI